MSKTKKKLAMNLPEEYVSSLSRRHNGAKHTKKEINDIWNTMQEAYKVYCKMRDKRDYLLDVEWDEKEIESYFQESRWYNAHRRLKRYEQGMKDKHRVLFTYLTHFDGNYNQQFSEFGVISADEIMDDFKQKYLDEEK